MIIAANRLTLKVVATFVKFAIPPPMMRILPTKDKQFITILTDKPTKHAKKNKTKKNKQKIRKTTKKEKPKTKTNKKTHTEEKKQTRELKLLWH